MSNFDFSVKTGIYAPVRLGASGGNRSNRQKLQLFLNVLVISAAFLFVAAAVLGLFP